MHIDIDLALLIFNSACFIALFVKNRIKRKVVIITKAGDRKELFYRNSQLQRERDEKSVLSSAGYRVEKHGRVWRAV